MAGLRELTAIEQQKPHRRIGNDGDVLNPARRLECGLREVR
jgi:hypothetical protein